MLQVGDSTQKYPAVSQFTETQSVCSAEHVFFWMGPVHYLFYLRVGEG